ncbi:MAG: histidine kinase [Bacteroidia bacterium]|nr:histidine kinase [Bacteroidia bacterium]
MIKQFANKHLLKLGVLLTLMFSFAVFDIRVSQGQDSDMVNLIGSHIIITLSYFGFWVVNSIIIHSEKIKLNVWFKALIALFINSVIAIVFYYLSPFEEYAMNPLSNFPLYIAWWRLMVKAFIFGGIFYLIQTLIRYNDRAQWLELEIAKKKKEKLQIEIERYWQMLNPHFLFNALSMIRADARDESVKADIANLAKVYLHLLDNRSETKLIAIEKVLVFLQNYLALFSKSHPKFSYKIDAIHTPHTASIPIFTLFMCIGCILKQYMQSVEEPFFIHIYLQNVDTIVIDTIHPKTQLVLENKPQIIKVQNEYLQYTAQPVSVVYNEGHTVVKLPLLSAS